MGRRIRLSDESASSESLPDKSRLRACALPPPAVSVSSRDGYDIEMNSAWLRKVCLSVAVAALLAAIKGAERLGEQRHSDPRRTAIRTLSPEAFAELPANIVTELQRRACRIPQVRSPARPNNVIQGEFAKAGQTDWAVLCSVKGTSRILVFWGGSEANPAAIAASEDRTYVQDMGAGHLEYSRAIAPVDRRYILEHYAAYGGVKPPPLDHQGIDDSFLEKASIVWYFHKGRWLELSGAD